MSRTVPSRFDTGFGEDELAELQVALDQHTFAGPSAEPLLEEITGSLQRLRHGIEPQPSTFMASFGLRTGQQVTRPPQHDTGTVTGFCNDSQQVAVLFDGAGEPVLVSPTDLEGHA